MEYFFTSQTGSGIHPDPFSIGKGVSFQESSCRYVNNLCSTLKNALTLCDEPRTGSARHSTEINDGHFAALPQHKSCVARGGIWNEKELSNLFAPKPVINAEAILGKCELFICGHIQGGSNMTGTNCDLFTHKQSRSYLNHLVHYVAI